MSINLEIIGELTAMEKQKLERLADIERKLDALMVERPKDMPEQMTLVKFAERFGFGLTKLRELVHSNEGFPAFNIDRQWYVDVSAYYRWRAQKHERSYKYAK